MSGGTIVRHDCGRLIIYGQRCTCTPRKSSFHCDCVSSGNYEVEGPGCRERRRSVWKDMTDRLARRTNGRFMDDRCILCGDDITEHDRDPDTRRFTCATTEARTA